MIEYQQTRNCHLLRNSFEMHSKNIFNQSVFFPGYKFSKFETLSIIVTLLQNFSFKPAFDNDYFVEPSYGFVTKPESEIWINIKSRNWWVMIISISFFTPFAFELLCYLAKKK